MCQSVPKKGKEMLVRDLLEEVVIGRVLKEMPARIKDADLTKDYEVYSVKGFSVDYTSETTEALDVIIAIKGDERLLSKMAETAISAIEQRVELESKIDPDFIAAAAKIIHAYAVKTAAKTKWALAISRNEGYWVMNIAVANDTDAGEMPAMVFTWCLGKEKKGD